jgi:Spy/CpxP family protein refolding chaperone
MKRQIIIGALVAATLAGGAGGAWANGAGGPPRGEFSPEKRLARLTKVLDLSDAQQAQIKALFAAEREKVAPLMEKVAGYRKQLHAAGQAAPFDEAAVRTIATNLAQTEIELTVARARLHSQINAILTAEQRALRDKLRPPMEEGPGHRPPFDGGE